MLFTPHEGPYQGNCTLGPPKRAIRPVVDADDESNWIPIEGKPDLWRNKVTGRMRHTPKDPTEWPFPTLPLPAPVIAESNDIDFILPDEGA